MTRNHFHRRPKNPPRVPIIDRMKAKRLIAKTSKSVGIPARVALPPPGVASL
jgi:hypothetical protein